MTDLGALASCFVNKGTMNVLASDKDTENSLRAVTSLQKQNHDCPSEHDLLMTGTSTREKKAVFRELPESPCF